MHKVLHIDRCGFKNRMKKKTFKELNSNSETKMWSGQGSAFASQYINALLQQERIRPIQHKSSDTSGW